MNKRKFGRTNLNVSELNLNTAKLGSGSDDTAAFALLDAYQAAGGSFLQSTGFSAGTPAEGASEEMVGRWLESRAVNRDALVLASHVSLARPSHGGSIAFINLIRETCERSLRRLRTKHLDLLICEWDERLGPVDDLLEATAMLIRAGCVRYAVAGHFPAWRVVDANHRAGLRGHARFEAVQAGYSLLSRDPLQLETLAMCREQRLGFIAASPLAGGFLARRPVTLREIINVDRVWPDDRSGGFAADTVLKVLAEVADQRGTTPAQIALAWVLQNSQVTSATISPPTEAAMLDLVRAADIFLSPEEMTALAEALPLRQPALQPRHV